MTREAAASKTTTTLEEITMTMKEKNPALAAALAVLEAYGITDHWRPLDGNLGHEIRAVVAEAVEAVEEGENPPLDDIMEWGVDYYPEKLHAMIAALEAARRVHTERAKVLAQAINAARFGTDEPNPGLLRFETREARLGNSVMG